MTASQEQKLTELEVRIKLTENTRDIARQKGRNNLADNLTIQLQDLVSQFESIIYNR